MAYPVNFIEENDIYTPPVGDPYPVWISQSKLGNDNTIDVVSVWQLTPAELLFIESEEIVFLKVIGIQPPVKIGYGDPVPFEGQNMVYVHPDCFDLPVRQEEIIYNGQRTFSVTSAWQLSPDGLAWVREHETITLRIVGGPAPVEVFAFNPFVNL